MKGAGMAVVGVVAAAAALLARQLPELKRYIKISRM
jgi:hypothetical protein